MRLTHNPSLLPALLLLLLLTPCTLAYKLLFVLHTAARSHHIIGSALAKGLARKGHQVTVISPFPQKEPLENYHDIATPNIVKVMEKDLHNILDVNKRSIVENIVSFHQMGLEITKAFLDEPNVQDLMKSNQTFDAIICEVFLSEALFGLSEHFKVPLIGLATFGAHPWNTDLVGSPSPLSYVPSSMLHFTDHMTLLQRIANLAFATFERSLLEFYYLPKQAALYEHYFPHNQRTMYEVRKNAALVLLNQHVSLSFPRPYVPNQIEVGGLHINRKRTPLPADLQKFMEEATHGVIYFSMGSNIRSKNLPLEKRQAILNAFRGLKQRVLWKFENPQLEDKPDNVFISAWFPQDDILAHPNVKVFVTHGGLLSTTESIYHGKAFVGIPIFGDQFLNMGRAVSNGYGIMLDYQKLNAKDFRAAIERILNEPTYTQRVQDMSTRYRDQPMKPLDLAVYWVEHIARHKGAQYLHCAGQDLNFWQYHNIDAMLILYGGLLLVLVLLVGLLVAVLRCIKNVLFKKQVKVKKQ